MYSVSVSAYEKVFFLASSSCHHVFLEFKLGIYSIVPVQNSLKNVQKNRFHFVFGDIEENGSKFPQNFLFSGDCNKFFTIFPNYIFFQIKYVNFKIYLGIEYIF